MFEPAKQICDFQVAGPAQEEPQRRVRELRQAVPVQKILAVYETEPDNFPRLMKLMFDMQAFGQPPADIIADLAPGLALTRTACPSCRIWV